LSFQQSCPTIFDFLSATGPKRTYRRRSKYRPSDGDFVIARTSNRQDGFGQDVCAHAFIDVGKAGVEFLVIATRGDQSQPTTAVIANGNFVVAWTATSQDGPSS
jgi:hypothetical protein